MLAVTQAADQLLGTLRILLGFSVLVLATTASRFINVSNNDKQQIQGS